MNLRRQESRYYCQCGHSKEDHTWSGRFVASCKNLINKYRWCPCVQFYADNLRYLELLVKEKEDHEKETNANAASQTIGTQTRSL